MFLGIDHLVIAVPDPDAAAAELEAAVGLAATGGGRHPGGTFNRLAWLGDSYVELIGVSDREAAATTWVGAAAVRALEAGGGFATWAISTDDLDADRARLLALGADLGEPRAGERARPDGGVVRWRLSAPAGLGPLEPPFLIEHDRTAAEWTPGERAARASEPHPLGGPVRLEVLELPVELMNLSRVSQRLLRSAGLRFRPSLAGRGARDADVGSQSVRLVPARPGVPPILRLVASGADPIVADVAGVRFVVRG
jgi:hypothetical protein